MDHIKDEKENILVMMDAFSNLPWQALLLMNRQKQWLKPWQTDGFTPMEYHEESIVIVSNHLTIR